MASKNQAVTQETINTSNRLLIFSLVGLFYFFLSAIVHFFYRLYGLVYYSCPINSAPDTGLKSIKKKKKPARKHECAKLENAESKPYQRIKGRSYKS